MAKNSRKNRNNNQNNNQNTGNSQKGKEKTGFFSRIRNFPENHPKIWRGGKIAVGTVTLSLAAIGGYGAKEAVKERLNKKPATPDPSTVPDVPDIPVVPDIPDIPDIPDME